MLHRATLATIIGFSIALPLAAGTPGRDSSPTIASPAAAAASACATSAGAAPSIVPPDKENYQGLDYAGWAALWWQWAWSIPDGPRHPFNCTATGADLLQNQAGHVWFLVGTFGACARDITIPKGTALFFPIGNGECSTLEGPCTPGPGCFFGTDAPSLSRCAAIYGDFVQDQAPTAVIDGKSVGHLERYRVQTPMFPFGPLPSPPIFVPPSYAGRTGQSVDAGTYLLLEPLSVGQHSIHFTAYNPGGIDTSYCVTVVP